MHQKWFPPNEISHKTQFVLESFDRYSQNARWRKLEAAAVPKESHLKTH
jgi:hypothetical protein